MDEAGITGQLVETGRIGVNPTLLGTRIEVDEYTRGVGQTLRQTRLEGVTGRAGRYADRRAYVGETKPRRRTRCFRPQNSLKTSL